MNNAVIQAKYDELEAIARQFGQRAQAIGELRCRLQRSAQPLEQGGWQGRGSTAFFREMNEQIVPATQRLYLALEVASAVTLQVSGIMREAELEAANVFSSRDAASALSARSGAMETSGTFTVSPRDLIKQYTNWGGLNLREEALATDLLARLPAESAFVGRVLDGLSSTDRDDVTYEIVHQATDNQLRSIAATPAGRAVLMRVVSELQDGLTTDGEAYQIGRVSQLASPSHAHLNAAPWENSPAVQAALASSGVKLQSINSPFAAGDHIYDEYKVIIDRMPPGVTPEAYLARMATDLNGAVNNKAFNDVNMFSRVNTGHPPQVGDIYHIDIYGPDNGSVMLVEQASARFVFQTVETPIQQDGTHPEYGAREFGFERNTDGSVTFYTRGASRPVVIPSFASIGRWKQEQGWTAMIDGIGKELGNVRPGSDSSWNTHRSDYLGSGTL